MTEDQIKGMAARLVAVELGCVQLLAQAAAKSESATSFLEAWRDDAVAACTLARKAPGGLDDLGLFDDVVAEVRDLFRVAETLCKRGLVGVSK